MQNSEQSFALTLLGWPGMALQSSSRASPDVPLSRSCSVIPHQSCATARAGGQESCWERGLELHWLELTVRPVGLSKRCWSCDSIQNNPRASGTVRGLCSSGSLSQLEHDGSWIQLDPYPCSQTFLLP